MGRIHCFALSVLSEGKTDLERNMWVLFLSAVVKCTLFLIAGIIVFLPLATPQNFSKSLSLSGKLLQGTQTLHTAKRYLLDVDRCLLSPQLPCSWVCYRL